MIPMSYKKECIYCKKEILMSEVSGKWLPLNLDNSAHDCRKQNGHVEKPLTIEARLERLERIVLDPRK